MSAITAVALIGLGEVGQILAADLAGKAKLAAYDILFSDPASIPARAQSPVVKCASLGEALQDADLAISAVTAASDLEVATAAAPLLKKGAFFLDLNSVSPGQKRQGAARLNRAGGRYIEAAVMTPFPPRRIASPMLLGGPHGAAFLAEAAGLGFAGARIFSGDYGKASATKMCRSVIIKGIEALLTESLLSARHYGVEQDVLASLSDLLPVGDWRKLATYMISRSLEHGKRRAEEMREVAETVKDAGIAPSMTTACVSRQDWAAQYRAAKDETLEKMLDMILTAQKGKGAAP